MRSSFSGSSGFVIVSFTHIWFACRWATLAAADRRINRKRNVIGGDEDCGFFLNGISGYRRRCPTIEKGTLYEAMKIVASSLMAYPVMDVAAQL